MTPQPGGHHLLLSLGVWLLASLAALLALALGPLAALVTGVAGGVVFGVVAARTRDGRRVRVRRRRQSADHANGTELDEESWVTEVDGEGPLLSARPQP